MEWKEAIDKTISEHGHNAVLAFIHEVQYNNELTNAFLEKSKFWVNVHCSFMKNDIFSIPEKSRPTGREISQYLNSLGHLGIDPD